MSDPKIEVRKNERGTWCVYLDGHMVSDHASHVAARRTAQLHVTEGGNDDES